MSGMDLFSISVPLWELLVRASAIYWFLFLILRFMLRRDIGAIGLADVLLLVLIADAAQSGMAGDSKTVGDAIVVVSTIVTWNWLLDWACYQFPWADRLANPRSLVLIRGGRILHRNLAREWISVDELVGKLREQGVERPSQVKMARLERDGEISVIRYRGAGPR